MRHFRNIWFALAAFLWLPAVAHCQLESLTGLEFLQCHEETADSHATSQDCDTCCSVEKSQFRAGQCRQDVPQPDLLLIFLATAFMSEAIASPPVASTTLVSAPPDLPTRWQFAFRTALPVRAPSLAS